MLRKAWSGQTGERDDRPAWVERGASTAGARHRHIRPAQQGRQLGRVGDRSHGEAPLAVGQRLPRVAVRSPRQRTSRPEACASGCGASLGGDAKGRQEGQVIRLVDAVGTAGPRAGGAGPERHHGHQGGVPGTRIGPPESPKQVPPVLALLENLAAVPLPAPSTPPNESWAPSPPGRSPQPCSARCLLSAYSSSEAFSAVDHMS